MAPDEYSKAFDKALSDLQARVQSRDLLNAEIAGMRETVRVLSSLVEIPPDKQREVAKLLAMADYATPSLTDAIRSLLLRVSPQEMTAIEVRNALEDSSDTEGCSLSACHAALKRLLSDEEIEPGTPKNGKASYKRVIRIARPNNNLGMLGQILGGGSLRNLPRIADSVPRIPPPPNSLPAPRAPRPPNWKGGLPAPPKK